MLENGEKLVRTYANAYSSTGKGAPFKRLDKSDRFMPSHGAPFLENFAIIQTF